MSKKSTLTNQLFFIDSTVPDSQTLLANLPANSVYYFIDHHSDGLQQMADILSEYQDLTAIHIISHGSSGSLQLGNSMITKDTLNDHSGTLATIGNALIETGDILLYGCDVAQGDAGQAFIQQLATMTGADVAASTDLTGVANQGGDWVLETSTGSIESTSLNIGNDYSSTLNYTSNPNYNLAIATDLVGLSVAAYEVVDSVLQANVASLGWTFVGKLTATSFGIDAQAVIVERTLMNGKNEMAIAFRGTQEGIDFWTDAAPYGFSDYYKSLRSGIENYVIQAVHQRYDNIYITGHSLGGAAAQIAMIDMLESTDISVWTDVFGSTDFLSPLKADDRFLDSNPSAFSADDWSWLRSHLSGVTIGAPSISVDATGILGIETAFLNDNFSLAKYKDLLFQFEHKSNSISYTDDPVASIASSNTSRGDELGSLVSIELSRVITNRYGDFGGLIPLHSSPAYYESMLRLLTNTPLLDAGNSSAFLPSLTEFVGQGSGGNDLVLPNSNGKAFGYAGSDILCCNVAGNYDLVGGGGGDTYTISAYGVNAMLSGLGGHLDRLYFNLLGQVSASVSGEDLVITLSSSLGQSSATIIGWYSQTDKYQLDEIAKIKPVNGYWNKEVLSFESLHIPPSPPTNSEINYSNSLVNTLGGTSGFGENSLAPNDDGSTGSIDISSIFGANGINFFGTNYRSVYVNNNGNISFTSPLAAYTPTIIGGSNTFPIIAPFWADVDTRGGSGTPTLGGNSLGSNRVWYDLDSAHGVFTMTWDDVGYFSSQTDKLNSFQLQLFNRGGGDFDIVYRYEDINWTTGSASGGNGGLGGTIARAGFSNGDGVHYFELPASGSQADVLALEQTVGNATNTAGLWVFQVRAGEIHGIGTTGNDRLIANNNNDNLYGGAGNDILDGGTGNDFIYGGEDNDTITGGAGNDYVDAGSGDDLIVAGEGAGDDTYIGGAGIDTIKYTSAITGITVNLALGTASGNEIGNDQLSGIENIIGGQANDLLIGDVNNNVINGWTGADNMTGGIGNDTYYVDNVGDVVTENAGEGTNDGVWSALSNYTLANNVEALGLLAGAINGTGNAGDNYILGNSASNTLNGGAGADILVGGLGDDNYIIDNINDMVAENTGAGFDAVYSSLAAYTLTANVEALILTGTAASGLGNALNNIIYGNTGNNSLDGGAGGDLINGGAGDDTLDGGVSDVYNLGVTDTLNGDAGNDAFLSRGFYGAGIYTGGAGIDTLNFSQADTYTAGRRSAEGVGINVNLGAGTASTYYRVADSFTWADANGQIAVSTIENVRGTAQGDRLFGDSNANVLEGGAGNDVLNGGTGIDTLIGGTGNDTYYVDNASDIVTENAGEGTNDGVWSALSSYTLGANVEALGLLSGALNGTGNAENNYIMGNSADNILDGGTGADTLVGGLGNDSYYVDNIGDIVIENAGAGFDAVYSGLASYTLTANVEALILTSTAVSGLGNTLNNIIYGNTANNNLDGGAGNDLINSGAGDDTLDGGVSDVYNSGVIDTLNGDAGNDTFLSRGFYGAGIYTGGAGIDLLDFSQADSYTAGRRSAEGTGVNVDLAVGTAATYYRVTDNFTWADANGKIAVSTIENVRGTAQGDKLVGDSNANVLEGGAGNDVLNGGAGADTLLGGTGNDTYYIDNVGDVVTENAGEGTDGVWSSLSDYTLADNVESFGLLAGALNGTGNSGNNYIFGNTANNSLTGGEGVDTLVGGLGKDTYNLTETIAATDTLGIATGDSLVSNYDVANGFKLGTGTINTVGVDRLDLSSILISANSIGNGADVGIGANAISSHSISNGIISFDSLGAYDAPVAVTTATNLANVLSYLQANVTEGNTVAFIADTNNTYVFQDGGATDTLVELVGVTATSVNSSGLVTNAVWLV